LLGTLNLGVAAAGSTDVVRFKYEAMQNLGLDDKIEDVLMTLTTQYHLVRILERDQSLFLYVALSKEQSNLAMALQAHADRTRPHRLARTRDRTRRRPGRKTRAPCFTPAGRG